MIKSARSSAFVRLIATAAFASVCAVATALAQQPAAAVSGPQQGIKLHGHWVIEIRNPDGTLSSRHEFDNSLTATGKSMMAALFGKYTLVGWSIYLKAGQGSNPCTEPNAPVSVVCLITEPGGLATPSMAPNLSIALPLGSGGFPLGTVQLSGHAVVSNPAAASFIDEVGTTLSVQGPTLGLGATVTSHTIPRITVTPGQILNIVVSFSFS
jgi:hypothetical protein